MKNDALNIVKASVVRSLVEIVGLTPPGHLLDSLITLVNTQSSNSKRNPLALLGHACGGAMTAGSASAESGAQAKPAARDAMSEIQKILATTPARKSHVEPPPPELQAATFMRQLPYLDPRIIEGWVRGAVLPTAGYFGDHDRRLPVTPLSYVSAYTDHPPRGAWPYSTYPMVLVGVPEERLDPQKLADSEDWMRDDPSMVGIVLSGVSSVMGKFLPEEKIPACRDNFDLSNFFVFCRKDLPRDQLYYIFPAIPAHGIDMAGSIYAPAKVPAPFILTEHFAIPRWHFKKFLGKPYMARIMSASHILTNATENNVRKFLSVAMNVGTVAERKLLDKEFAAFWDTNEEFLATEGWEEKYPRKAAERLEKVSEYINLSEFDIVKDATVKCFRPAGKRYKKSDAPIVYDKDNGFDINKHSFPFDAAPTVDISQDKETMLRYRQSFIILQEKYGMETTEVIPTTTEDTTPELGADLEPAPTKVKSALDLILESPDVRAVIEAEERAKNIDQQLTSLGLTPVVEAVNKPHTKVKKVSTEYTKKSIALSRDFEKYSRILRSKSRRYDKSSHLSNTNPYYMELTTHDQVLDLFAQIHNTKIVGYDIETSGLHPLKGAAILTHQFSPSPFCGAYIRHQMLLDNAELHRGFVALMESQEIEKVIHNVKFEYMFVKHFMHCEINNYFDTMLAAHLIDETVRIGLKPLAEKHLQVDMIEFAEVTYGTQDFNPDAEFAIEYSCADADIALQLRNIFKPIMDAGGTEKELQLTKGVGFTQLFEHVSLPLAKVLGNMEMAGILVNPGLLKSMQKQVDQRYQALWDEIQLAKQGMNPSSDHDLGKFLYEELKLPVIAKTPGGQPSTNKETLGKLYAQFPEHKILATLIEFSKLSKFKTSYTDSLPKVINPTTCSIHTEIKQTGTVTGRFSSANPNLQNLRKNQED